MSPAAVRAWRDVTTVTFDAGGTLLRPHPSVGEVYRTIALRHGADLDAAKLNGAFRLAFSRVSKCSLQLDPAARERDFWRRIVHATFAEAGPLPRDFDACFHELWETFAQGSHWRHLPGALETVRTLHERGYRLAVLSNWDHRLHRVLEETGLRAYFAAVVISSEVGAEKPDAGIFRAAERLLAAPPHNILHVGDSVRHDVEGARAAGWQAALVGRDDADRASADDAPATISELRDLLALLPERAPAV